MSNGCHAGTLAAILMAKKEIKKLEDLRSSYWISILYPESCAPDWMEQLDSKFYCCYYVSPLHDKDVNDDGELKKPHYHLIFKFDSLKSFQQVKIVCDSIGAIRPCVPLTLTGCVRYLCHLDNPEKHRYQETQIICHGVDYLEDKELESKQANHKMLRQILSFCISNGIFEFCELIDLAAADPSSAWFDLLSEKYTLFLTSYLSSRRAKYKKKNKDEGS